MVKSLLIDISDTTPLITGVLDQGRVAGHLVCGERIDIVVRIDTGTGRHCALEIPQVFAGGKASEAYQVATTAAFEIEFAAPLVTQYVFGDRCKHRCMGTIAQLVEVGQRLVVLSQTPLGLGTGEVHLGQTEQGDVCVHE